MARANIVSYDHRIWFAWERCWNSRETFKLLSRLMREEKILFYSLTSYRSSINKALKEQAIRSRYRSLCDLTRLRKWTPRSGFAFGFPHSRSNQWVAWEVCSRVRARRILSPRRKWDGGARTRRFLPREMKAEYETCAGRVPLRNYRVGWWWGRAGVCDTGDEQRRGVRRCNALFVPLDAPRGTRSSRGIRAHPQAPGSAKCFWEWNKVGSLFPSLAPLLPPSLWIPPSLSERATAS